MFHGTTTKILIIANIIPFNPHVIPNVKPLFINRFENSKVQKVLNLEGILGSTAIPFCQNNTLKKGS